MSFLTQHINWLLAGDPAIRWQVLRDLLHAPEDEVARERARIPMDGWGRELLAMQREDGMWPAVPPYDIYWRSTLDALLLLREFGIDPAAPPVRTAIDRLRSQVTWGPEFGDTPFFAGEVEPCINGRVLALGAYFGHPSETLLTRLLREQLPDGGWNCDAPRSRHSSFHTTLCVLEGLLEYERATAPTARLTAARHRAEEYLLQRRLHRSLRTGEIINPEWSRFAFPTDWHYDLLWALDYFRRTGTPPDPRLAEALTILRSKCTPSGAWPLDILHEQDLPFTPEPTVHALSRWITLRALRVLDWAGNV